MTKISSRAKKTVFYFSLYSFINTKDKVGARLLWPEDCKNVQNLGIEWVPLVPVTSCKAKMRGDL